MFHYLCLIFIVIHFIEKKQTKKKQAQEFKDKYGTEVPDTAELQAALGMYFTRLLYYIYNIDSLYQKPQIGIDGVESAKKKALDEMTKVLEGNWTPFDVYVSPFRSYAKKILGENIEEEKRNKWIEKAGM